MSKFVRARDWCNVNLTLWAFLFICLNFLDALYTRLGMYFSNFSEMNPIWDVLYNYVPGCEMMLKTFLGIAFAYILHNKRQGLVLFILDMLFCIVCANNGLCIAFGVLYGY
jgi:hypothetical protein